jgi:hypothetical protein
MPIPRGYASATRTRGGGGDRSVGQAARIADRRDRHGDDRTRRENGVGDHAAFEIGQRDHDQQRAEDEAQRQLGGVAGPQDQHGRCEQRRHSQLGQRVTGGNRRIAVPASAPQEEPRDDGDVVVGGNRLAAMRAPGTPGNERLASWHPVRDNGREAAKDQARGYCQDRYHCLHRVRIRRDIALTLIGRQAPWVKCRG